MDVQDLISKLGQRRLGLREIAELCGLKVYDLAIPIDWSHKMRDTSELIDFKFDPTNWVWCYDVNKVFGEPVNLLELFAKKLWWGEIITTGDAQEVFVAFELLLQDQRACHEVSLMKSEEQGLE